MLRKQQRFKNILRSAGLVLLLAYGWGHPLLPADSAAGLLPEISGWQRDGQLSSYGPENLYEYIDGAAENFLSYDFQELAVQNYKTPAGAALTLEIYRHRDRNAAFGIYSSEKPLGGDYLAIGSQGYREEGILNFFSGSYYVKINDFELADEKDHILEGVARRIAERIPNAGGMPPLLAAFPVPGKVNHSERFILKNFLGQPFLHSVFVADYEAEGRPFQVFIIDAGSAAAAVALVKQYRALAGDDAPTPASGRILLRDPYNGPVHLAWRDAYVWGITFSGKPEFAGADGYLTRVRALLFPTAAQK